MEFKFQIRLIKSNDNVLDNRGQVAVTYGPLVYMLEKPISKTASIINKYMYSEIIWMGIYCALICLLFLKVPLFHNFIRTSYNNKYLMTCYFAIFIFMGICNAFIARSTRLNIFAGICKNKVFLMIFSFIFIVQLFIIYNGNDIFRSYGLTLSELLISLLISLSVFPIDIIRKYILKKKFIELNV